MAARIRQSHQDDIRAKIKADRLVAWMHCAVFGEKFQGKTVNYDQAKVTIAKTLLNKVLPDLVRSEVTGKDGGAVQVAIEGADKRVL